jgi:hypothetical protein
LSGSRYLPLLAALPALVLAAQVHFTCGLVYSLDDPYIHLALARQILHGHYGINPGEFAAPSSSILWPFLLAPFAFTRLAEFLPLVINLAALAVAVWWLARWLETWLSPWWALAATTALALLLNLYGLVLTGMENSLQVTLVIIVAVSLMREGLALRERLGWPFWLSVTLLPLVRYEGLAISLPVLAFLFLSPGRRAAALAAGALIAIVVVGFSLFLHSHGVGLLPSSVLAKTGVLVLERLPRLDSILVNIEQQLFFLVIALFAAALFLREGRAREAVLLVLAPTAAHLMFGRYGWFGRYHIYFAAWIVILFVTVYVRAGLAKLRFLSAALAVWFAYASLDSVIATLTTPLGSRNVADQQKQMAIIARDYLKEPVAVNDLGYVSFYPPSYILDLGGLASYDALLVVGDPASDIWITDLMIRHHVEQAMVYDRLFPRLPANWIRVATLHLPLPWVTVGGDKVAFYSTSPEAAQRLRQALERYRKSSPQAAMMLELVPS